MSEKALPRSSAFTSDKAHEASKRRWHNDPAGVEKLVRRVIARAPALTDSQREAVRAALVIPARADQSGGGAA